MKEKSNSWLRYYLKRCDGIKSQILVVFGQYSFKDQGEDFKTLRLIFSIVLTVFEIMIFAFAELFFKIKVSFSITLFSTFTSSFFTFAESLSKKYIYITTHLQKIKIKITFTQNRGNIPTSLLNSIINSVTLLINITKRL